MTASRLRVAAAQIAAGADPAANLDQVAEFAAAAASQGAELVLFPEATMRCFGRSLSEVAEPPDGPWATRLRQIAEQHRVVIAAGMFCPAGPSQVTNTMRVVGPGIDAGYDKVHLFDAFGFRESDTVRAGEDLLVLEVAGVGVGFATCYDVRFPGLFVALAERGAQVICLGASWGAGPGKVEQWELLVRARALDSTTFLVAAGQADPQTVGGAGAEATVQTAPTGVGHSLVVSPRGEVLGALAEAPGLLVTELDLAGLGGVRETLPVLANRRW